MFDRIKWQAFLRVHNEQKVFKILKRFSDASGCELSLESCERCWHDKSLFEVWFTSPLESATIQDAVFHTLVTCQSILPYWTVAGPHGFANGQWEFRGDSMKIEEGIQTLRFEIGNPAP